MSDEQIYEQVWDWANQGRISFDDLERIKSVAYAREARDDERTDND